MPKTVQQTLKKVAECLYLNESSGKYYALVKKSGKQIKRSLKTQDRKLAERRLREFREEVGNLSPNAGDRRLKFSALAERWLSFANTGLKPSTAKRNGLCVKNLKQTFGEMTTSSISRLDCENWASRRAKGISARTFNYDLQVLKRILNYAAESGILLKNPSISLKPRKSAVKQITVPTREQFERLIRTLESMRHPYPRNKPAIELVKVLAFSGMRLNEGASIKWSDIDFERGTFIVSGGETGTKNQETRTVPLFPRFRALLGKLQESRVSEFPEGFPKDQTILTTKTARTAIESACRLAKIPHFDHHCMRHFFTSNAIENGVDFKTIAAWLGHKDGGVLVAKTYGHLRDTHSHEMAKLMV